VNVGKPAHLLATPFGKTMSGVTLLIFTIKVYKLHGLSETVDYGIYGRIKLFSSLYAKNEEQTSTTAISSINK